nr:acyl-CoA dehydrogenase [Thauera sp.]
SLGARNDVHCVSIEHKLGIHASPTAVLAFGDNGGAIGTLVGEPNRGLEYMFIMMNEARFAVGMEGLALSERSYQHAVEYAKDRVQGTDAGVRGGPKVSIIHHADVRRLLMNMRSKTEAMRALAYVVGAATDKAHSHPDEAVRAQNQAFVDLMIPVVKGWFTENSIDVTSDGVQVHGGMGFIEETGAAQFFRDSRITTIYEGTTAIQANDLIGRKIARENGATVGAVVKMMRAVEAEVAAVGDESFAAIARSLKTGISAVEEAVAYILATYAKDIKGASVGSVPFLKLLGIVAGGWQMGRAALVAKRKLEAGEGDASFYQAKIVTARFYADHVLSQASGLSYTVVNGAAGALALSEEQF